VALKVKLGPAEMTVPLDPGKAKQLITELKATPTRRWRRSATWPVGSTRRCSPNGGLVTALEAQAP